MKKSTAIAIASATLPTLLVTTKIGGRAHMRKIKGHVIQSGPPSEEMVKRLNGIGREYPFCVNYKSKRHDPL